MFYKNNYAIGLRFLFKRTKVIDPMGHVWYNAEEKIGQRF